MKTRSGDMAAHVDASSSSTTPSPTRRTRKAVAWLLTTRIVLLAAVVAVNLWLFFHVFGSALPPLPVGDGDHGRTPIRFPPQHLDDVRRLLDFMEAHAASNGLLVLALYCWAFLLKQAFAIPGSALMNILGGALYGQWRATLLVSTLTMLGSTICYMLSHLFARQLVDHFFHTRITALRQRVTRHRHDLAYYLLFARMFPLTPNWLLNMVSPHAGVRVRPFMMSVFVGLIPYNFVTTGAGDLLDQVRTMGDVVQPGTLLKLATIAAVVLALPVIKRKYGKAVVLDDEEEMLAGGSKMQ